jgi:hypothetical protein
MKQENGNDKQDVWVKKLTRDSPPREDYPCKQREQKSARPLHSILGEICPAQPSHRRRSASKKSSVQK